jgi:hypothetical protein
MNVPNYIKQGGKNYAIYGYHQQAAWLGTLAL